MTQEIFYQTLRQRFCKLLEQHDLMQDAVEVICRALSPDEAIGQTRRKDFPILTGKDVMIQATFRGSKGQAFTDAPTLFQGSMQEILELDLIHDAHGRSLFIAVVNAVMAYLGLCTGTVHCRTEGPELCAQDILQYLRKHYPDCRHIAQIGYQPALLEMLSGSEYMVRVADLNPANVGKVRYGVLVEDSAAARESLLAYADLILCTGSTVCNGTIVDYLELDTEVLFYGTTMSGVAPLMDLPRVCFADRYE